MRIHITSFHGNPNVGLYIFPAPTHILVGSSVQKKDREAIAAALGRPVSAVAIAGTDLVGVFLAGNGRAVLVPEIAYEDEIAALKRLGLPVKVFKTRLTALGNNLLVNGQHCLANPDYTAAEAKALSALLGVPVTRSTLAGCEVVGSVAAMNSRGCLVHHEASKKELHFLKTHFGVPAQIGTVNLGSPIVHAGLVCTDEGFLIGDQSGGPEMAHAERVLGFLES